MKPKLWEYTKIPIAPSTVEKMVPTILMVSTLIPEDWANRGFSPPALRAMPVFVLKNSTTMRHIKRRNRINPVGIMIPKMLKERKLFKTFSYRSARLMVTLNPLPIGHAMAGLLNGAMDQKIHIRDTMENPT